MKDLSQMTEEERRAHWARVREYSYQVQEVTRMLEGNKNRLCVTDDVKEAYQQYYYVTMRAAEILKITLKRIAEFSEDEK